MPDTSSILISPFDRPLIHKIIFQYRLLFAHFSQDVTSDGIQFISAGNDKMVKVWNYDEGICLAVGEGHSGYVNQVMISPGKEKF